MRITETDWGRGISEHEEEAAFCHFGFPWMWTLLSPLDLCFSLAPPPLFYNVCPSLCPFFLHATRVSLIRQAINSSYVTKTTLNANKDTWHLDARHFFCHLAQSFSLCLHFKAYLIQFYVFVVLFIYEPPVFSLRNIPQIRFWISTCQWPSDDVILHS